MKKISSILLVLVLSFSTMTTAFGQENSSPLLDNTENKGIDIKENQEYTLDDIFELETYIFVENGHFKVNSKEAVENGIDFSLIQKQQEHFNFLNQQADNGNLVISQDLSIKDLKSSESEISLNQNITTFAASDCKGITRGPVYYWWGHKSYADSCDTKKLISDANTVAASGGIIGTGTGTIGLFFPILLVPAGIAGVTGGWYYLFATRLDANNNGRGVIVDLTYAAVFDITPQ